jgi:hypothetical protein
MPDPPAAVPTNGTWPTVLPPPPPPPVFVPPAIGASGDGFPPLPPPPKPPVAVLEFEYHILHHLQHNK